MPLNHEVCLLRHPHVWLKLQSEEILKGSSINQSFLVGLGVKPINLPLEQP